MDALIWGRAMRGYIFSLLCDSRRWLILFAVNFINNKNNVQNTDLMFILVL